LASPSSPPLRQRALRAALLAAALLAAGCRGFGDPGQDFGVFFPRHGNSGPGPGALLEGRLETRGGCIWIVGSGGDRVLPIWPPRFGLRVTEGRLTILDASGGVVAREGDLVRSTGGETVTEQNAYELIGREPPESCRAKIYWTTGDIRSLGPARPTASPEDGPGY
jgi:hypothetical protein